MHVGTRCATVAFCGTYFADLLCSITILCGVSVADDVADRVSGGDRVGCCADGTVMPSVRAVGNMYDRHGVFIRLLSCVDDRLSLRSARELLFDTIASLAILQLRMSQILVDILVRVVGFYGKRGCRRVYCRFCAVSYCVGKEQKTRLGFIDRIGTIFWCSIMDAAGA